MLQKRDSTSLNVMRHGTCSPLTDGSETHHISQHTPLPPTVEQTVMASHRDDWESVAMEEQGEKKTAPLSFGFTKTVNRFKPATAAIASKSDERDYLTGIDRKELQR